MDFSSSTLHQHKVVLGQRGTATDTFNCAYNYCVHKGPNLKVKIKK